MPRTRSCSRTERRGRLVKADQFARVATDVLVLADEALEVADAFVTLAVHAGIAAADVICCARLGVHAQGEAHSEAVALLDRADGAVSRHLRTLLAMKTNAGYGFAPATSADCVKAQRAVAALLEAARAADADAG